MADFNIFGTAPESLAGLLGEQATKDLQRKAMTTGLINTALGYLVQPKNQNLGLGRILGQSLMSGMTGAQGVYTGALEDWQTKQKIADLQRKQSLQEKVQGMIGGITDPNEQLYAQLSPEQYVAGKVKPVVTESPIAKLNPKDYTPESWASFITSGNDTTKLREATTLKEKTMTEEPVRVAYAMFNKNLNELNPQEMQRVNNYIENSRVRVANAAVPSQSPTFKDAGELRKEYRADPTVKAFNEVNTAYNQIKTSLSNPSPAGDLAGATKFMKLLDPTSVVRDTEMSMAMNATGLWDRVQNYHTRLVNGEKLNPTQRKDFMDSADRLYQVALQSKNQVENQYSDIAKTGGLDAKLVIGSPTSNASIQSRAQAEIERRKKQK